MRVLGTCANEKKAVILQRKIIGALYNTKNNIIMRKFFLFIAALYCAVMVNATEGALPGLFSVSATTRVQFSQGNLQYQASTNTWRFAEHQYDMIGLDNAYVSPTYSGWIDLFGWGTGSNPTLLSGDSWDYYTFTDWGTNAISNGGNQADQWHTLTQDEWIYLVRDRLYARQLIGLATVNSITGIILLPDNWVTPSGLVFNDFATKEFFWEAYQEYSDDTEEFHYGDNVYTSDDWLKMEAAGAVFLPAAGDRIDQWSPDMNIYSSGRYWSSTPWSAAAPGVAYYFSFNAKRAGVNATEGHEGYAVRLVQPYEDPQGITSPSLQGRSGEATKTIRNGQLLIERNGKTYNASGTEVR